MPRRIRFLAMIATLVVVWAGMPVSNAAAVTYAHPALGVQLTHAAAANVLEDQFVGDTFGFTIAAAEAQPSLHTPLLLRVGQIQRSTTVEQKAQELRAAFADLPLTQHAVTVARRPGIAISGVPGADGETTHIYVSANKGVYEIIYGGPTLDELGWQLLNGLQFNTPRISIASLRLPSADATLRAAPPAAVLQQHANESTQKSASAPHADEALAAFEKAARAGTTAQDVAALDPNASTNAYGCVEWPSWKGMRTPYGPYARGNGWSKAGPSWYGEGGHVRCNYSSSLNDHHAIDFPLREWDSLYPLGSGRVVYAGWASGGWTRAGRTVIIDYGNGFWGASFHMRSISVSTGQYVSSSTRIGYAGGSAYGRDGYFVNHLHQGWYYNARLYAANGGVYGGHSAEPHYVRTADGGIYANINRYAWIRY